MSRVRVDGVEVDALIPAQVVGKVFDLEQPVSTKSFVFSEDTLTSVDEAPPKAELVYGTPSGPNYLLFLAADRLADSLQDRSGVGWSPTPHAPTLGAPQRALDPKPWQNMGK